MAASERVQLPTSWDGLRRLQTEFDRYQRAAHPEWTPSFFALELCGEAGELANLEKKAWKGRPVALERFEDEAADVAIAIINYANSRGVDLAAAVATKLLEIERRRVGGSLTETPESGEDEGSP